jgi:hypothetical protein
MTWVKELKKSWRARLSAVFLISAIIVLVDEIVKEGYSIDLDDFVAWPPSHEQIFLLLLALGILLGLRVRKNG